MEGVRDPWESRGGVALALEQLAPLVTNELVTSLSNFYVSTGLRDPNEEVQGKMLFAGVTLVGLRGKVSSYLNLQFEFESYFFRMRGERLFEVFNSGTTFVFLCYRGYFSYILSSWL